MTPIPNQPQNSMDSPEPRPSTGRIAPGFTSIVGPGFQSLSTPTTPTAAPTSIKHAPQPAATPRPARTPSRVAEDAFVDLRIGPPESDDAEPVDGARLARRLLVAFLLIAGVWVLFVTLLAQHISPMVPVLASGAIMLGSILAAMPERKDEAPESDDLDDAKPIGCCSGPRPLGEMSRKAARRGNPPPGACCR